MKKTIYCLYRGLAVGCLTVAVGTTVSKTNAQQPLPPAPFLLAPAQVAVPPPAAIAVPLSGVVQSQFTGVDLAIARQLESKMLTRVRLIMFAKGERTLVFTGREDYGPGRFALTGTLEGISPSSAVLAVWDGAVTLDAHAHGENTVRLRNAGNGGYWLEEVNPAAQGVCGTVDDAPAPAPAAPVKVPQIPPPNGGDGNSWADLLAYYTPPARDAAGGDAAISSSIASRVATANSVHNASGTGFRIRLVRISLMDYSVVTDSNDLFTKLATVDGAMDSVFADIAEYGADLTHLWATYSDTNTNGRADLPGEFGVNRWDQPQQTFTHECGHNLGCRHQVSGGINNDPDGTIEHAHEATYDWYLPPFDIFLYTSRAQTIMWGNSATTRIDRFSDPDNTVTFSDPVLGEASVALGTAGSSNNAQFIWDNRLSTVQRKEPRFYVAPGDDGRATPYWPSNNLNSVYDTWYFNTQATPAQSAVIRAAEGNYSAPTRIATKSRIEKWGGGGNVRIAP